MNYPDFAQITFTSYDTNTHFPVRAGEMLIASRIKNKIKVTMNELNNLHRFQVIILQKAMQCLLLCSKERVKEPSTNKTIKQGRKAIFLDEIRKSCSSHFELFDWNLLN